MGDHEPGRPGNIVVGRIAPSPTGGLHLGHARTFLIAWLAARQAGGKVILRIEDLDASRVRAEVTELIRTDLVWLGLDWDEGPDVGGPSAPYVQSERVAIYEEILDRLIATESVYPCTCSRADIVRASSAPHAEDEGPTYPGTCAHRRAVDAASFGDRLFAWRFRVPAGMVEWHDLFRGPMAIDPSRTGGDFVVARNGVGAGYQLAVVADDALMGVTRVIRGDDLIPSTPRQILLFRRLGRQVPEFGHVPLVFGPDGRRLAKRDGSIKLATLRDSGVDPKHLIGSLARSCGWSENVVPSRPVDWIGHFDWRTIPQTPWQAAEFW